MYGGTGGRNDEGERCCPTNEAIDAGMGNAYASVQREGRIQSAERAVPTLSTTSKVTNLLSA